MLYNDGKYFAGWLTQLKEFLKQGWLIRQRICRYIYIYTYTYMYMYMYISLKTVVNLLSSLPSLDWHAERPIEFSLIYTPVYIQLRSLPDVEFFFFFNFKKVWAFRVRILTVNVAQWWSLNILYGVAGWETLEGWQRRTAELTSILSENIKNSLCISKQFCNRIK